EFAVDIHHAVEMYLAKAQRVVAGVEEFDFRAQHLGRALRLVAPARLDLFQRGAGFLPGELALAALAERQAGDLDAITSFGVKRYRAAGAPDEIAGMRGDHEAGLVCVAHIWGFLLLFVFGYCFSIPAHSITLAHFAMSSLGSSLSASEFEQPCGIIDQCLLLKRRLRRKQRNEVDEVAVIRHHLDVGMRPVGSPDH